MVAAPGSSASDCCVRDIQIIKNEVGCRDDTMPKKGTQDRHCEVVLTVCNNILQPPKTGLVRYPKTLAPKNGDGLN